MRDERRPLLQLRGATRRYAAGDQEVYALRGVDLDIFAGEIVALVGASGSGKSTLMNIIGCLDRLTAGSYRVEGQDTAALRLDELARLRREHFGFVFQRYNLLAHLSAQGNVEMPAVYADLEADERRIRASRLLERLGLGKRGAHYPSELSGGQQQRVSIARALMNGGQIILADEPTGALDSASGREVMDLLLELNRQGHTLIIATHDASVAAYRTASSRSRTASLIPSVRTRRLSPPLRPRPSPRRMRPRRTPAAPWMRSFEVARMAWAALLMHRLRTALTLLGVVIGIASVTLMVAVGESTQRVLQEQFRGFFKVNALIISPGANPAILPPRGCRRSACRTSTPCEGKRGQSGYAADVSVRSFALQVAQRPCDRRRDRGGLFRDHGIFARSRRRFHA